MFEQELRRRLDEVSFSRVSMANTDSDLEAVLEKARQSELVVCAAFARVVTGTGTVGLPARLGDWVQRLSQIKKPLVNIALGNPYIVQSFPQASTYLCTFSNADVSQAAAVKAVFGEIPIKGKLPVSLPGVAALRDGIELEKLEMRLTTALPSDPLPARLSRLLEALLTEQLGKRSFPGASVSIGYRGTLVLQEGYGRLDYSPKSPSVATGTLYDLASLTKVITATTLAMRLFERGQLKLEYPVSRYFPDLHRGGPGKESPSEHLLTHSSGLPAHLPLYKEIQGKRNFVQKIVEIPLEYEPGTQAVYSDLGIILLGDIIEKVSGRTLDRLASPRDLPAFGNDADDV